MTSLKIARACGRFSGVIPQMPLPVPLLEEFLEHLVDEDAELFRVQRRFVFRILLEAQHALRKKSERALEIPLERADAVGRRLDTTRRSP